MRIKKNKKGFTLIELLVVIAIIGLLSTLAVVALNSARSKSRDAKRVADVKQIQTALELYFTESSAYPLGSAEALGDLLTCSGAVCNCLDEDGIVNDCDTGGTTYMGLIPSDPSGTVICANPATTPCVYSYTRVDANNYWIVFWLENATGDLSLGNVCANEAGIISQAGACT